MKKTIGIILALLFAGLLTLIIGSPIKNDMEAKKVANATILHSLQLVVKATFVRNR